VLKQGEDDFNNSGYEQGKYLKRNRGAIEVEEKDIKKTG
jgi:hypothetical protein